MGFSPKSLTEINGSTESYQKKKGVIAEANAITLQHHLRSKMVTSCN